METLSPTPPIQTRGDFQQAIRDAFDLAASQGCKDISVCDVDFADWPLGERGVVEALTRWAYAHRRLRVYAVTYEDVVRRHPRWVDWRRQWAHVVECRQIDDLAAEQVPRLWLAPGLRAVRLVDPLRFRGYVDEAPGDLLRIQQGLEFAVERAVEAFPATVLGL